MGIHRIIGIKSPAEIDEAEDLKINTSRENYEAMDNEGLSPYPVEDNIP